MVSFPAFCQLIGLRLEPFQKRIAGAVAGPERELLVSLPRGQGKTTLLSAVALHHLVTVERAEIYCAAASQPQARILFEDTVRFARVLDCPNIVIRHHELRWCPDPAKFKDFTRHMRVLPAVAPKLHGLTPSLGLIDELHALSDGGVYEAMRTAVLKRPDSKLAIISTAGSTADSPLGRLRARALAQPSIHRRGALTDARGVDLRMLDWSVADDADIDDMRLVKQCNPASWITVKDLRSQREALPELAFRRFHANQWAAGEGAWLPPGAWQACVGEPIFEDSEEIWVGVDIGGERSATAVVWVNANKHVGCEIFHGDDGVLAARDLVEDLAVRYRIASVVFDPWRAGEIVAELAQRGIPTATFPQNDQRMIPASQSLYRALVDQELTLPDHAELAEHAANAIAKHGRRGWRIASPTESRRVNIDGVVALAMAVDQLEHQPEPMTVVGWM
jgi:phage terminase large subunit-like protein